MLIEVTGARPLGWAGDDGELCKQRLRWVLAEMVGGYLCIDPGRIVRKGRGDAQTAFARHLAIYLACTRFGLSFTEAGQIFGRDRTTASYACRRIEEDRDEAAIDRLVERIDRAATILLGRDVGREHAA